MKSIELGTLTVAQRGRAILINYGLTCTLRRHSGIKGCSYILEVSERDLDRALALLRHAGVRTL